jgi:predicted transcriptional regulator
MKDLVNKEYLDSIKDDRDYRWLAKVMSLEGYFNQKPDKVKELVYGEFIV